MKLPLSITGFCLIASSLLASMPSASQIIERARATVGTEEALNGLVTLQMRGTIEPGDPKVPEAAIFMAARRPLSQRLEVRAGEVIETTILNGEKACMIRSSVLAEAAQMRTLTEEEKARVVTTTRQIFNFYLPDSQNGETVSHEGIEEQLGMRCHKLVYTYPDSGVTTTRYFSVNEGNLVATISHSGVASIEIGVQRIGGIRYPEKIEYYEKGEKLHTLSLNSILVNRPLEGGLFEVPKGKAQK